MSDLKEMKKFVDKCTNTPKEILKNNLKESLEAGKAYEEKNLLWDTLKKHAGHHIEVVVWGDDANVSLVCEDCQEIVLVFVQGKMYK